MSNLYRGFKVTPTNSKKRLISEPGIYRGTKFNVNQLEKSSKASSGTYRGVNWAA